MSCDLTLSRNLKSERADEVPPAISRLAERRFRENERPEALSRAISRLTRMLTSRNRIQIQLKPVAGSEMMSSHAGQRLVGGPARNGSIHQPAIWGA